MLWLSRKDIEHISRRLLRDYLRKVPQKIDHIDPADFAEKMCDLQFTFADISEAHDAIGLTATSGVIITIPQRDGTRLDYELDGKTAFIDQSLVAENQIGRLNFTMMHEAAHQLFWMRGIMRTTMRIRRERSMKKILFICHGNICRSPMAEFVMKDLVKKAGLASRFYIESAATSREEIGNPVYPPARRKLAEHGISCEGHAARQLTNRDYDEYDLLIGMDQANLRDMYRICGGDYAEKMSLLMDHTARPGNVADPWYTEDFEATWRDVLEGCQGLLKEFMTERGDSNGTKR